MKVNCLEGEDRIEKWDDCEVVTDMVNEMRVHMKKKELRGAECKSGNENEDELGVHNEYNLVKGIIRDALGLEESLRLYMMESKVSSVQEDKGQDV